MRISLVLATAALTACWTPREGAYLVSDVSLDRNECGFDGDTIYDGAVITLTRDGDDNVVFDIDFDREFELLVQGTGSQAYQCDPEDIGGDTWEFTCNGAEFQTDYDGDATVTTFHNIQSGAFDDSESRMTGQFVIELSCAGRDCAALADDIGADAFPCRSEGRLTAVY